MHAPLRIGLASFVRISGRGRPDQERLPRALATLLTLTERPGDSERSGNSSGVHGARPTLDLHLAQGLRVFSNPHVQPRADSGVSDPDRWTEASPREGVPGWWDMELPLGEHCGEERCSGLLGAGPLPCVPGAGCPGHPELRAGQNRALASAGLQFDDQV